MPWPMEPLEVVGRIDVDSYTDRIRTRVRDLIVAGRFPGGEWQRLADLARVLGTSITPVRTALAALQHDGLVEIAKGRGFRVRALSLEDVNDTYLVNGFLAAELTARSAARADDALLARCTALQVRMERTLAGSLAEDIDDLNWTFHREIHLHACSPRLEHMLRVLIRSVPHNFHTLIPDWTNTAMSDHRRILDALAARDPDTAAVAAREHIALGCKLLVVQLERTGYWSERNNGQ